jgi:hypothetical protein
VVRVATVRNGKPHVTPLYFLWHQGDVWLYSLTNAKRWQDVELNPHLSIVADDGATYAELHGAEFIGRAEPVGEQPRRGLDVPELRSVETQFARKYLGSDLLPYDGRHAWLRVRIESVRSWDFRKLDIAGQLSNTNSNTPSTPEQ